jgi:DNA-binding NtrC family response regulator
MLVRVLLVFEDAAERERLARLLPGDEVATLTQDAATFWQQPESESADLVILDRDELPGDPGEALDRLHGLPDRPEAVIVRRHEDPDDTARLQAAGCLAILPGTLDEAQLGRTLARVVERLQKTLASRVRAEQGPRDISLQDLESRNPGTRKLFAVAGRVAASDTSLLVLGETGVGKEWLARAIHAGSPRSAGPFVAVNCGAVPETLLESELFGHERGAFTGAVRARRGYFELAHRGTLFLDEVAEMPSHLQIRLLRVLQDCRIQRLGGESEIAVDTRIIAATNRDLAAAMKSGGFRQDLYYRLAVVTLKLPPLRDRPEDVRDLALSYQKRLARKLGRPEISGIAPRALAAMEAYSWPGNVRELINVVERAVLLGDGPEIDLSDLPADIGGAGDDDLAPAGAGIFGGRIEDWLDQTLEAGRQTLTLEFERRYLAALLERNQGNLGRTAEDAGVDPRTLYNKMRQLGLRKESYKAR